MSVLLHMHVAQWATDCPGLANTNSRSCTSDLYMEL